MTDLADRFRREGLADAAVLLVAKRVNPTTDLDDWGRLLGLDHRELVAAVDRFKQLARPLHSVPTGKRSSHGNAGRKIPSLAERRERDRHIREMFAGGEPLPVIAAAVGLTPSRVRQIVAVKAS